MGILETTKCTCSTEQTHGTILQFTGDKPTGDKSHGGMDGSVCDQARTQYLLAALLLISQHSTAVC